MERTELQSFPVEVADALKSYVYRLIDPRNGETFYVGKGKGDRVFAHIKLARNLEEGEVLDNKVKRINEINLAHFEVAHVIHQHGMDDDTATQMEAALINAYPGLTNIAPGGDCGPARAEELIRRNKTELAEFRHRALLINVNRTAGQELSLYEATRFAWKIEVAKAKQAEVILAVKQGLIKGAYIADDWLPATTEYFPERADVPGRYGFIGREASDEIKTQYYERRVPDEYRFWQFPVRYTWN